jgi:hypothetical protein
MRVSAQSCGSPSLADRRESSRFAFSCDLGATSLSLLIRRQKVLRLGRWAETFDQHSFVADIVIAPLALVGVSGLGLRETFRAPRRAPQSMSR